MAKYDVAAYIWPAYTGKEPRTRIFWPEEGGEWQSVRKARLAPPKENGYHWDYKPLWGYPDEAEPAVMEFQINEASRHGVNVFAYDWYWFDRRPFLEQCLNEGFLGAKNNHKMKFYVMWANHDANYSWDVRTSWDQDTNIWRGDVDRPEFEKVCKRLIEKYFRLPNYYTVDGKPLFSIYMFSNILKGLDGLENTRDAFRWLREECVRSGLPGVHIQIILQNAYGSNWSGVDGNAVNFTPEMADFLEIDSVTHYNFTAFVDVDRTYPEVLADAKSQWEQIGAEFNVPYLPHVSLGWDNNPRFIKYHGPVMTEDTPENVKKAFEEAKAYLDARPNQPQMVTVNSWNEWTESSYLQPDQINGYGYLEAVRDVFGGEDE